jgi:hypothetical protein
VIQLSTKHEDETASYSHEGTVPEGLTVVDCQQDFIDIDGNPDVCTYKKTVFPELGPARLYDSILGGVVIPISGKKYRVIIEVEIHDEFPSDAVVTFIETEEDETEFTPYDIKTHHLEKVEEFEKLRDEWLHLADNPDRDDQYFHESDPESYREDAAGKQRDIDNINNGIYRYSHGSYAQFFGQPFFIQSEMTPNYEGRSAFNLVTVEGGWGDSGNLNIMIGLDTDGVPAKAWFEASCC